MRAVALLVSLSLPLTSAFTAVSVLTLSFNVASSAAPAPGLNSAVQHRGVAVSASFTWCPAQPVPC